MEGVRFANIGLAVNAVILIIGCVVLRNAGTAALQALVIVGFLAACFVYVSLDERDKRRRRDRSQ